MSETWEALAGRLGVQPAPYAGKAPGKCDACKQSVPQVVLVRGKEFAGESKTRKAGWRSRQVCHFCLPQETVWPDGKVDLAGVK